MNDIHFERLTTITPEIVEAFSRWENDESLKPFAQWNKNREELERERIITAGDLEERLEKCTIFLIYRGDQLAGEVNYAVDPPQLYKKEKQTAWIGITIGEESCRGLGIGGKTLRFLETYLADRGLKRIELGVFEFNEPAISLYRKTGFREIGTVDDFTYYEGRMRRDIRMEKYLK